MITKEMVEHIKDTLNGITKGKNTNFGTDLDAGEDAAPSGGILIVLTDEENLANFTGSSNILASSTVLGKDEEIFTSDGKTINVINIPYSETISINTGNAIGFAIVEVNQEDLVRVQITGNNPGAELRWRYIIKAGSGDNESVKNYKILFSGALSGPQTIESNNSFSLSNIKITFN